MQETEQRIQRQQKLSCHRRERERGVFLKKRKKKRTWTENDSSGWIQFPGDELRLELDESQRLRTLAVHTKG